LRDQLELAGARNVQLESKIAELTKLNASQTKKLHQRDREIADQMQRFRALESDFIVVQNAITAREEELEGRERALKANIAEQVNRFEKAETRLRERQLLASAEIDAKKEELRKQTRAFELKRERWHRKWTQNADLTLKASVDEVKLQKAVHAEMEGEQKQQQQRVIDASNRRLASSSHHMDEQELEVKDQGERKSMDAGEEVDDDRRLSLASRIHKSGLDSISAPTTMEPVVVLRRTVQISKGSASKAGSAKKHATSIAATAVALSVEPKQSALSSLRGLAGVIPSTPRTPKQFAVHSRHVTPSASEEAVTSTVVSRSGKKGGTQKRHRSPSPLPINLEPEASTEDVTNEQKQPQSRAKRSRTTAPISLSQPATTSIHAEAAPPSQSKPAPRKIVKRAIKRPTQKA
jgi:hypothetical protein